MLPRWPRPSCGVCRPGPGLAVCAALFWLTHTIPYGHWPWGTPLPQALYDAKFFLFLGFWPMNSGLTSSDYFPLMPWLFLFWAGLFARRAAQRHAPCSGMRPRAARPGRRMAGTPRPCHLCAASAPCGGACLVYSALCLKGHGKPVKMKVLTYKRPPGRAKGQRAGAAARGM